MSHSRTKDRQESIEAAIKAIDDGQLVFKVLQKLLGYLRALYKTMCLVSNQYYIVIKTLCLISSQVRW